MSSRNKYLKGQLRAEATVLWRSIQKAQTMLRKVSKPIPSADLKAELNQLVQCEPDARLDYVDFFDPVTLAPMSKITRDAHMALAVFIGKTRLIDNARL